MSPETRRILSTELGRRFLDELHSFVFFHLGSDADVRVEDSGGRISVNLKHRRVHPIHFELTEAGLSELLEADFRFEEFLLDFLTRQRRSE